MARYNDNRGDGIIGGGGVLGEIENSRFLWETRIFDIFSYVNSDVTDTSTYELWFC